MKFFLRKHIYKMANIFTIIYLGYFLYRAFVIGNREFAGYIFMFILLFILANLFFEKYVRQYIYLYSFIVGFLLLHILGGIIYLDGIKMYDYYFFGLVRYDWFMHILGGFLSARIAYEMVKENFIYTKNSSQILIMIIIVLAIGVGTLNEIIEFIAVIFLNAQEAVGGYYNNLTDICNNLLGSIIYLLVFSKSHKFKEYNFEQNKKS